MFDADDLAVLRRAYARQITFAAGVGNAAMERAFAAVRREDFLGPGPWPIFSLRGGYRTTPDADPAWLYADVLVGIVPARGLNNGQPSGHAMWIGAVAPKEGEHVVHVGAGVGYYSAIMAHMVGSSGALTAIEFDKDLAGRAAVNLSSVPNAKVVQGDGSSVQFAPADVIYVNAGATRPADIWLDNLRDGGRLLLPLTSNANWGSTPGPRLLGAVFLITRHGGNFEAKVLSPVGIFPCEGARDDESERALAAAFEQRPGTESKVKRLVRGNEAPEADCWVKAPGWALTYR